MEDDSLKFPPYSLSQALLYDQNQATQGPRRLRRLDEVSTLPGQPWIDMSSDTLLPYLRKSFSVHNLDLVASYLWLAGTPSESHVSPLHHLGARGRKIVVTEEPRLHLVWYHDKIFIKPIPSYLFCQPFWQYIAEADECVWRNIAGFIRTYCYLIRHEVDFRQAVNPELYLIPTVDDQPMTFSSFVRFIAQFEKLSNSQVAQRYSYGMLRLTRLNYMAPFLMGKLTYFHVQPQWTDYLSRFILSVVTFFAVVSTILNSMQVELAVQGLHLDDGVEWPQFVYGCRWVAVCVITLVVTFMVSVLLFVIAMMLKELLFAITFMRAKRRSQSKELQAIVAI